jgi:hypothetical protein
MWGAPMLKFDLRVLSSHLSSELSDKIYFYISVHRNKWQNSILQTKKEIVEDVFHFFFLNVKKM